jgi:hypothetical protein
MYNTNGSIVPSRISFNWLLVETHRGKLVQRRMAPTAKTRKDLLAAPQPPGCELITPSS